MEKSEIAKFREALKNGEVKFIYTKKDGTKRCAVGTLCEKLIPKTTPMDTYEITFIKWDLDLDDLEKNGLTAIDKVGRTTVNPAFNIQRSAIANILGLLKELSISARQRRLLTSAGQTEEVDPMDEFLQKISNE